MVSNRPMGVRARVLDRERDREIPTQSMRSEVKTKRDATGA